MTKIYKFQDDISVKASKELEKCSRDSQDAIGDVRKNMNDVNVILGRIPTPDLSFIERIMKGFLESSDDDEDDEEKELEEKMKEMINSDNEEEKQEAAEQENEEEEQVELAQAQEAPSPSPASDLKPEESDDKEEKAFELSLKDNQDGGMLSFF